MHPLAKAALKEASEQGVTTLYATVNARLTTSRGGSSKWSSAQVKVTGIPLAFADNLLRFNTELCDLIEARIVAEYVFNSQIYEDDPITWSTSPAPRVPKSWRVSECSWDEFLDIAEVDKGELEKLATAPEHGILAGLPSGDPRGYTDILNIFKK